MINGWPCVILNIGKSYTMLGSADIEKCFDNGEFDNNAGLAPRAVSELFRLLNERIAQCSFEVFY